MFNSFIPSFVLCLFHLYASCLRCKRLAFVPHCCDFRTLNVSIAVATCQIQSSPHPSSQRFRPSKFLTSSARPSLLVSHRCLCLSVCRRRCPHPVCASGSHSRVDVRLDVSGLSRSAGGVHDTQPDQTRKWWMKLSFYLCLLLLCRSFCTFCRDIKLAKS